MTSQQPKSQGLNVPSQPDRVEDKKMFFNETQDEYEDSKIVLPPYLYDNSSHLIPGTHQSSSSKQIKKSSKNNKSTLPSDDPFSAQQNPKTISHGSIPSKSGVHQAHQYSARISHSSQKEEQFEFNYEQEESEFDLTDSFDQDIASLINIDYRMMCLMTMIQNNMDQLIQQSIFDEDILNDTARLRFILMQLHRKTIDKATDENDDEFSLDQYAGLINSQNTIFHFLFIEYPDINSEIDEDFEIFRYEGMTDDEYMQEYCWTFDQDTLRQIMEYIEILNQFDDQFGSDQFSPLNYLPQIRPSRPPGPGPLDQDIKGLNYFDNIQKFTKNDSKSTKPNTLPTKSFEVNIRRQNPNQKDPNQKDLNHKNLNPNKSNQINLFNFSPISITHNNSSNQQTKNLSDNITYQQFVGLLEKQREKHKAIQEKEENDEEQNKKSHFDAILGLKSDEKSENYLKQFVGQFYKKQDIRQKEFLSQLNQPIYTPKNENQKPLLNQSSNNERPFNSQVERKNPFESAGRSLNHFSQPSIEEVGKLKNNLIKPHELNPNVPLNTQESSISGVNKNYFSLNKPDCLSTSPPSFSNFNQVQKSTINPFDSKQKQNINVQSNNIQNPFSSSQNLQFNTPSKHQSNVNNSQINSFETDKNHFQKNVQKSFQEVTEKQKNPFSKSLPISQNVNSASPKTPQTPQFGAFPTSQLRTFQTPNFSNSNFSNQKSHFSSSIQQSQKLKYSTIPNLSGTLQKRDQKNQSPFTKQLESHMLPNIPSDNLSNGGNIQASMPNIQNQVNLQMNLQGQNNKFEGQDGFRNVFSNIPVNFGSPISLMGMNSQLAPQNVSIPSIPPNNINNMAETNILSERLKKETKIEMRNSSLMSPEKQPEQQDENKQTSKQEKSNCKSPYDQQQIINMKVHDFIGNFCRSEMTLLYKDFFQELLTTKKFKTLNSTPDKSILAKINYLEQNMLTNKILYNNHPEISKKTMNQIIRNQPQNEKKSSNDSPFHLMNQIHQKLQKALNSSLSIESVPSIQNISNLHSFTHENSTNPIKYREFSFEDDLSRVQKIQDDISSQLSDLQQKLQQSIPTNSQADNSDHIFLTLHEELASMMNAIKKTEKWLIDHDFCSLFTNHSSGNVGLSQLNKLRVQNQAQNETQDFQVLKTIYKNLSLIDTNLQQMVHVLPSII